MSLSPLTATPEVLVASTQEPPRHAPFTREAATLISVLAVDAAADLSRYLRRKQDLKNTGLSTRWPLPPDELPVPPVAPLDDYSEMDEPFPSTSDASPVVEDLGSFGLLLDVDDDYRHPNKIRRVNSVLKRKREYQDEGGEDSSDSSESESDVCSTRGMGVIYNTVFASRSVSSVHRGLTLELGSFGETYYRRKTAHGYLRTISSRYDGKQPETEVEKDVEVEVEDVEMDMDVDQEVEGEKVEVEVDLDKEVKVVEDEDEDTYKNQNSDMNEDEDDQGDANLIEEQDQVQVESDESRSVDSITASQDSEKVKTTDRAQIEKLPPEYRRTMARQAAGQVRDLFEALAILRQTKSPSTPSERPIPASSWKTMVNAAVAAGWPVSAVSKANARLAAFYQGTASAE